MKKLAISMAPFDLSFIPIGAYDKAWQDIHMDPQEAVRAHRLLNGGKLVPIHWGTFDLGLHAWYEPINWLMKEAKNEDIPFLTPKPGKWIHPDKYEPDPGWWKAFSREFD